MKRPGFFLFYLFPILIWGCQKPESKKTVYRHEIHIGFLEASRLVNLLPDGPLYKRNFSRYYHLDLAQDSLLIYFNQSDPSKRIIEKILAGPYEFNIDSTILQFIKLAPYLSNFKLRKPEWDGMVCDQTERYYVEYIRGEVIKYFVFRADENDLNLFSWTNEIHKKSQLKNLTGKIRLNPDSLYYQISSRPELEQSFLPLPVQQTIKFIPPVKKRGNKKSRRD